MLGRTKAAGGWYKVHGTTLTGWISANPALSALGRFGSYSSAAFSVLYPAGWTAAGAPKTGVTFRAPTASSPEEVVITAAPLLAKLPSVRQGAGVSESSSQQVVACGVTSYLDVYTTSSPGRFYADVSLVLAAHHFLGLKATLGTLSELPTFRQFVNSVAFPFPECVGGPPTTTTKAHTKTPSGRTTTTRAGAAASATTTTAR